MKKLLFFINILGILALLIAYCSPYISPHTLYIPQLLGLFINYIFLFNLCFVLFWLLFQRRYAKYSFLALLPGLFFFSRLYKAEGNTSFNHNEKTISLLSYNVRKFMGEGVISKKSSAPALFKFVASQNTSFVCFQEYQQKAFLKHGKKTISKNYPYYFTNNELATFSKFPIIRKEKINFKKKHYANGIITDIVIAKDTLRLINVHLESNQLSPENKEELEKFVKNKNIRQPISIIRKLYRASLKRTEQINLLAETIKTSPYPVILCGDFNDTPLSYTYQSVNKLLKDSFVKKGKGDGKTFKEGLINVRIDYVFSNIAIKSHHVPSVHFSDHKPVIVSLSRNLD